MQNIKKILLGVLIGSVTILTFIAILSIWDVLSEDSLWKSISTIGIIAFSSVIILIAINFFEHKDSNTIAQ